MDIRENHSIFALLGESFQLVNRSFSVVFTLVLVGAVGTVALYALAWIQVPQVVIGLLNGLYSTLLSVMFFKLFASRAENDNLSLSDIAAASVLPAVYTIILGLLCGVSGLLVGLVSGVLGAAGSALILIPIGLVGLFIAIRFSLAPVAIALREQNPINALGYSWQLTGKHFWRILGALLIMMIVPTLLTAAVIGGAVVLIPLYFADSFNLAQLSGPWIAALVVFGLFMMFVWLAMCAYWVLVFLNLDYQENRGAAPAVPLPQVTTQNTVLPPGSGPVAQPVAPQEVQILRASVKSHDEDDALSKHLEQVYQPKPEDIVEYTEEDRMPTILFDDEMAKQMEANRAKWEEEKAKARQKNESEGDDGISTIKMSR